MHINGYIFRLYLTVLCAALLFACSNGGGVAKPVEEGAEPGASVAPGDSAGYTRMITESGDTVYVKDTVTVFPDTTLRWVGNSAVLITEIASLNLDWLDMDGDDPSWVEVYNSGAVSANLKGWALVENLKEPKKWVFGDEIVAAKSFRTVFCDKKNVSSVAGLSDGKDSDGKILHSRTHTNWKLDKDGGTIYLVDPSNAIRDSVAYPQLKGGVSWGIVDGGDWKYFGTPTPEKKNTEATAYDGMAPSVDFGSVKAGFYADAVTFNPPQLESGVTLRCTTDGSAPTASSQEFNAPMTFSKNTSLRCSAFKSGTLTKDVITNTIFVGETVNMPVVSISVDPVFFEKYYRRPAAGSTNASSPDGAKYLYEDVEFPVHVEYFPNGSNSSEKAWEIEAGISMMGNYSRLERKKSVAIVMREEYQDGWLHYPLFETRKSDNDKYKGFNLRNNGNRFVSDYFADALGGAILEGSGLDYQRSRQVVVFYNGKYFGIHDMRERFNKNYVETNYGIDASTVEVIKHLGRSITSNTTTANYEKLLSTVAGNDFTGENNANYQTVKTMMDVGNFADYMVSEMYIHNGDWPNNNVRAWRSPDQPYKFMVYDLDHGFDWHWGVNSFGSSENMFNWVKQGGRPDGSCYTSSENSFKDGREKCFHVLYVRLIKNPDFKRLFINRSAMMIQKYLNATTVESVRAQMAATIDRDEAERDLDTNGQKDRGYGSFTVSNSGLTDWAKDRDVSIIKEFKSEFGLGDMVSMQINASGSGSVLVEGRKVPSSYSGSFFSGNKMELTAVPNGSATFVGWSDGKTDNPRIVDVKDGATYTATFK